MLHGRRLVTHLLREQSHISFTARKRAAAIVRWLQRWPDELGPIDEDRVRVTAPAEVALRPVLDPQAPNPIAPLETFQLPHCLSGADGVNRAPAFCFISARNDLEAVETYLARYADSPETSRSYRKELERLILWCALVVRKPLSSLLADDCEAYKTFLAAPDPRFRGPKAPRDSERWRPFGEEPMKPESQRLAVVILRGAFDWLVKVRYLGGNPWTTVKDPKVTKRKHLMKIDRALRRDTWETVVEILQRRAEVEGNGQDRVALAAMLLMGDSGLRRAEVAAATRANLVASPYAANQWTLTVVGKGSVEREVPVNARTEAALRAHWRDRRLDFDDPSRHGFLIAPLVTKTSKARRKKLELATVKASEPKWNTLEPMGAGADAAPDKTKDKREGRYHVNSLYYLIEDALGRVREFAAALSMDDIPPFSPDDLAQLENTSAHAFRHTYATNAVNEGMPMHVVQDILGHVNIGTTKVYARTRSRRIAEEAAKHAARVNDARAKKLPE